MKREAAEALHVWLRGAAYAEVDAVGRRCGATEMLRAMHVVALHADLADWIRFVATEQEIVIACTEAERRLLHRLGLAWR